LVVLTVQTPVGARALHAPAAKAQTLKERLTELIPKEIENASVSKSLTKRTGSDRIARVG
jgi:hypothetical protein